MTHLSLFSGFGGLDLAAEWAGIETVGQCEWADYPTKVLEKHWPTVPRWRDIRTLTGASFYERTGLRTVDLVSGGFPCQPFSVAGQRKGRDDDRFLWPEMLRVIKEIRPAWIVGENVAGLLTMAEPLGGFEVESRTIARLPDQDLYHAVLARQERMYIVQILEELSAVGYDVQTFCIPACGVGANHQRYRIAIVGHAKCSGREWNDRRWASEEPSNGCKAVPHTDGKPTKARRPEPARQQRPAGTDDGGDDVSHAIRNRGAAGVAGAQTGQARQATEPNDGGQDAPDAQSQRRGEARHGGAGQAERTAGGSALADTERTQWRQEHQGRHRLAFGSHSIPGREESSDRPERGGEDVFDAAGGRLPLSKQESRCAGRGAHAAERTLAADTDRRTAQPRMGGCTDGIPAGLGGRGRGNEWFLSWQEAWADGSWEAGIPRLAVGWNAKKRVEMLKGFGNAVVPQAWYPMFRGIADVERSM